MAHHEPHHQDLRCLQIQLFLSRVFTELKKKITGRYVLIGAATLEKIFSCFLLAFSTLEALESQSVLALAACKCS